MAGLPSTAGRLAGGCLASKTSLKSASPPHIRSRAKRWKFAFPSVVRNASSAVDGEVPVAMSMQILGDTKVKVTESTILLKRWVGGKFPII